MEKQLKSRIEKVCKEQKVDHVYVTSKGHIFLPKAKSFAYDHAKRNNEKVNKFSKEKDGFVDENEVLIGDLQNGNKARIAADSEAAEKAVKEAKEKEAAEKAAKSEVKADKTIKESESKEVEKKQNNTVNDSKTSTKSK